MDVGFSYRCLIRGLAFGASVSNGVMDLNGFVFAFVLVLVLFSWGGRALREALLMQSELFAGWAWLGWGSFRLVGGGEAASVGRADLKVLLDGRARNFGGWGFGDWRVGGERFWGDLFVWSDGMVRHWPEGHLGTARG